MMQKIQRFGGAMFTPVLLFAFSGIMVGLGTIFQNELIMGSIASPDTMWYQCWYVLREAAWTVFRQVPMLFVVGLPIGLAKKQQGRACLEALVLYITFNYAMAAMLTNWGSVFGIDYALEAGNGTGLAMVASIKTLDTGMIGALVISGVTVWIHNRYFDTPLPDWLGSFKGSSFVCVLGYFAMIILAGLFLVVWPRVQEAMMSLQTFFQSSGAVGIWVYSFLERILIPTGLHHFIYTPFVYDSAVVAGGIKVAWAESLTELAKSSDSLISLFPGGGFSLYGWPKMFASIGIGAAFYATAKPAKKKAVISLMVPVCLTAILCGITEPIEFTFLFVAPVLFFVHALLSASLCTVLYLIGLSGDFTSGLIQNSALNFIPLWSSHGSQYLLAFAIAIVFVVIWFFVFSFMIVKMNLPTPGREEDDSEVKLVSKAEYKASKALDDTSNDPKDSIEVAGGNTQKATGYLVALGGKENILDVTNCATRLRVNVKDASLIQPLETFKKFGAHGLVVKGNAIQVIVGLGVPSVREEFEKLLND
ncbi:alpha-glucoside-specific PTS transporter subunit IIBC [Amedibacillus sp. YH-ame6]